MDAALNECVVEVMVEVWERLAQRIAQNGPVVSSRGSLHFGTHRGTGGLCLALAAMHSHAQAMDYPTFLAMHRQLHEAYCPNWKDAAGEFWWPLTPAGDALRREACLALAAMLRSTLTSKRTP